MRCNLSRHSLPRHHTGEGQSPVKPYLVIDCNSVYIRTYQTFETLLMKLSQIKPISYLKAHASELIRELVVQREPLVITQNGEATAVIQDIHSYQQNQETLALLKILALGNQQVEIGKTQSAKDVIKRIRKTRM